MEFISKHYDELTKDELYEILRTRSEIFIVEQTCPYQDIDGIDKESLHVFTMEEGRVTSYLRAFRIDEDKVQMGRVLTLRHGEGLGGKLLKEGLRKIREEYDPKIICIEAQVYATGFYEREGFKKTSAEFLEDGIPHIKMELVIKDE